MAVRAVTRRTRALAVVHFVRQSVGAGPRDQAARLDDARLRGPTLALRSSYSAEWYHMLYQSGGL
jgi:hypothetical protein